MSLAARWTRRRCEPRQTVTSTRSAGRHSGLSGVGRLRTAGKSLAAWNKTWFAVPRVIVSCSGLGCGPERRRGDGEAIEEDDRSEAASGAVRSAGGALGGGGGTTQRRVGTVGS